VLAVCREAVLRAAHGDSALAGHPCVGRTSAAVAHSYYWPRLFADVAHFVCSCKTCAAAKSSNQKRVGAESCSAVPIEPFTSWAMDLIGPRIRSFVSSGLNRIGCLKDGKTLKYLGVESFETVVDHIQNQMYRYNKQYTGKKQISFMNMELDHIQPVQSFALDLNHYSNLQSLLKEIHGQKSSNWMETDETFWRTNVSDQVWLDSSHVKVAVPNKLTARWFGLFVVVEAKGARVTLDLPATFGKARLRVNIRRLKFFETRDAQFGNADQPPRPPFLHRRLGES